MKSEQTEEKSGLFINTRTASGNKLYRNKELIPYIVFLEPEEKTAIKTWKDLKDLILFKMQKGKYICGKPMTNKELNQFCKILFKGYKGLNEQVY